MPDRLHILLVDDEETDRIAVRRAFKQARLRIDLKEVADLAAARVALVRRRFDCALVDYRLPDGCALDLIRRETSNPDALPPVIVMTGQGSEAVAVESMKAGAADYLPKAELTSTRLIHSIRTAIRIRQSENRARRADEDLRASEKRFRELFENSPDPILVQDPDGQVLDANPAACTLHGLERSELVGLNRTDLKPPDRRKDRTGSFEQLVSGQLPHAEGLSWHRAGRAVPVEARAKRIEYEGKPAVLVHLRDITERKRSEAALRESEQRFRRMADTAPVLIWTADADQRNTYFNKPWLDFTGRSLEQNIADGWSRCIHPDDFEHCREFYAMSFEAHRDFRMEYRLRRHDGRYCWMLDSGTPRFTPDGRFAGYIGSCIDITRLKEAREDLEQRVAERTADLTLANRRLGREVAERHRAEERALQFQSHLAHVDRLSTMGEMASGLAHELNQPLGAIVNYLQGCARMIDSGSPNLDHLSNALRKGAAQAERAGQIIRRLRLFVSRGTLLKTTERLDGLIREVADLLAVETRRTGTRIALDLADPLPPVPADRIQVQQVILNLMRNGIEAMEEAGITQPMLTVTTTREDAETVGVAVSDTGPGTSEEMLARLFDPFFTTKGAGMGMGLTISRSIIEAHGGRLWADPNPAGGITFRFTLPTTEEKDHEQGEEIPTGGQVEADHEQGGEIAAGGRAAADRLHR